MATEFRVGLTSDFLRPDGSNGFGDIGLAILDQLPHVKRNYIAAKSGTLHPADLKDLDALLLLGPKIASESLVDVDRLAIVARFGAGYDSVDLAACTEAGIAVTITPDGVRRPLAVAAMTMLLAAAHKLTAKDRLVRRGGWWERIDYVGHGVTGKTVGIIGLGNAGLELCPLARAFDMRVIGHDPVRTRDDARMAAVELVDLETLFQQSDFVVVMCAYSPQTHHLINEARLRSMKSSAYFINVARGPTMDQSAVTRALQEKWIEGAALDVFEQEPLAADHPLLQLDNVTLNPHAIIWNDECFYGNGSSACRAIASVAKGEVPEFVINRAVIDTQRFKDRLEYYKSR
jgi:phosphoglycerate dehydrogenase-like enzyme